MRHRAVAVVIALVSLLPVAPTSAGEQQPTVVTSTTGTQLLPERLLSGRWTVSPDGRTASLVVEGRSDVKTASRYRARWLSGWVSSDSKQPTTASFTQCSSIYGSFRGNQLHRVRLRQQEQGKRWSAWTDLYGAYPGKGRRYSPEPGYRTTQESATSSGASGRLIRVEIEAAGVVSEHIDDVGMGLAVSLPKANPTVYTPVCPLARQ